MRKTLLVAAMTVALAATMVVGSSAADHDGGGDVVVVSGNTIDATGGWWFERDAANVTGHEFTEDGLVTTVGPNAGQKFIAENFLFQRVSEVGEISYRYVSDAPDSEFYINVYVNHEAAPSDDFYDCRYDYTAVTVVDGIKTVTTSGDANHVASRNGTACPASLADSPIDSFVRAYAINVGDTSAQALPTATILSSTAGGVTYVFRAAEEGPVDVSDCKHGGYEAFGFRNQGQCIASLRANERAGK